MPRSTRPPAASPRLRFLYASFCYSLCAFVLDGVLLIVRYPDGAVLLAIDTAVCLIGALVIGQCMKAAQRRDGGA